MNRCLYCYKPLKDGQTDFHPACARKLFGVKEAPALPYRRSQIAELAKRVVRAQTTLTGVQAKLSLDVNPGGRNEPDRFTIVGLWGRYILKPQTDAYRALPELEDLTMHMAEAAKIAVVPHSLIRFADGELCYITRRIDRERNGMKIAMEDMCQLTLHPTEYKYKGSHEQIAKTISQYSNTPKLDLANYMQLLLFCFVTGNNDMHLKNFSLYRPAENYQLTPAYDLLNVAIANPKDKEELALTLAGKKTKIRLADFLNAAKTMGLEEKVVQRLIAGLHKALPQWQQLIKDSFLSEEQKQAYEELVIARLNRLKTEQVDKNPEK